MKKLFSFLLLIIIFFINIPSSFAHPVDISVSTATIKKNHIHFTTYFHSFEIEYLLRNNNIESNDGVITYYDNAEIIKKYVENNLIIKNNNSNCEMYNFELKQDDAHQILTQ
jgi:hypothetical protein